MTVAVQDARTTIGPQPGPQTTFLACRADIGIYGGGVYGGKTWALTTGPLAYRVVPGFSCVTFRRTRPDIRNPGSLWDESMKWYPMCGGTPREASLEWDFPGGVTLKFDGLQHDSDALSWKSAQITCIQFDQLEEFTEFQFWYMQTRNRSACGVEPYTRAGCNPLADSWLAAFLHWWWDPDTGYAIAERSGAARWFIRVQDEIVWADFTCPCDTDMTTWLMAEAAAKSQLDVRYPGFGRYARSVAFIRAALTDNPIGVAQDPGYEARVRAQSLVEQERLLGGNWKIRPAAGLVFDRAWFDIVGARPAQARWARYWDKAATAGGGDYTVGTLMGEAHGVFYVGDVIRGQWSTFDRERLIKSTAQADPPGTVVGVEQEPGSGGVDSARLTITGNAGVAVLPDRPTGRLEERAQPLSAQAGARNVKLVRGPWNEAWLAEHHAFPTKGVPDDQVASSTGAFKLLTGRVRDTLPPISRSYVSVR